MPFHTLLTEAILCHGGVPGTSKGIQQSWCSLLIVLLAAQSLARLGPSFHSVSVLSVAYLCGEF